MRAHENMVMLAKVNLRLVRACVRAYVRACVRACVRVHAPACARLSACVPGVHACACVYSLVPMPK